MQVLLFGGSNSGKSALAESIAQSLPCTNKRYYLATMKAEGPEAQKRIAKHQAMREGKGFITLECSQGLDEIVLEPQSVVLLECISNLVANEMFVLGEPPRFGIAADILLSLDKLRRHTEHLIIVSNNVGDDGVCYTEETRAYVQTIACVNQQLCAQSTSVLEVVCGIPLTLKGLSVQELAEIATLDSAEKSA